MRIVKENDEFDNEQMLLHFYDIYSEIKIESNIKFEIFFNNSNIEIDNSLIKFALSYYELKKKYILESETLLNQILFKINHNNYFKNTDYNLKDFFSEILYNYNRFLEKEQLKTNIVWLKKDET
jgi:hypothetical protein